MNTRHTFSIIAFIILLIENTTVQAQDNSLQHQSSLQAKVIDLFNKDSVFELWYLYKDSIDYFDEPTRLHAEVPLYNAFNRPDKLVQCLDSLRKFYRPEEYPEGFKILKVNKLLELGKYKELVGYYRDVVASNAPFQQIPGFEYIEYIIPRLADIPNLQIDFPQSPCTLPIPYNYPLRIPVRVNGIEMPDAIIDTGSPCTILSIEAARKCKVYSLGDTLISFASTHGTSKVSTGIIKELRIKNIVFHNLKVLVCLTEGNPIVPGKDILIGLSELSKLSSIELAPGKITFTKNENREEPHPTMRFTGLKPYIHLHTPTGIEKYMMDTGAYINHLCTQDPVPPNAVKWKEIVKDSVQFSPQPGPDEITGDCNGLLGFSYFSSFDSCKLDFAKMNFTGNGYHMHNFNYLACIMYRDYPSLDTYYEWYERIAPSQEKYLLKAFFGLLKNRPRECVQYTDSLLGNSNGNIEVPELQIALNIRAVSFAMLGEYQKAIDVFNTCSNPDLEGSRNKCLALAKWGASQVEWKKPSVALPASMNEQGIQVCGKIDHQDATLYFSPDKDVSTISIEDALKYKMEIAEYKEDSVTNKKIAIAPQVVLGGLTFKNVWFNIQTDESPKGIFLGNNILCLVPQFVIEKQQISLNSHPQAYNHTKSYRSLLSENILSYIDAEGEKPKGFAIGVDRAKMETVQLKTLIEKYQRIIVDMRNMQLTF